ncbi:replication initiation protein [Thiothrix unzii]|uniref:Replication initiation protein n=1 Tax=Thiothrix unzii TaxID=111769 RepID=A0A975FD29_9GAMM|nr:replication initiation protein [Thiothrix unzii]QTR55456.1 replication initiation protein [Thiothrix unzii]QTR55466.1 replication initiation protein [Thiothrix unzii]
MFDNENQILIKKSNDLIEARYRLTLGEQRLVLLLASQIRKDDKDFNYYEIKISDFAEMFGLKTDKSLYEKVEKIAGDLLGKKLYLKNDGKSFEGTVWLSYVKYVSGSGTIKLRFDDCLKPYLLQLKHSINGFTQYKLHTVMSFKSAYSIRLYELLKMEVWKSEKLKSTQFEKNFSLDEYRRILGVDKNAYPIFADFRKRVIDTTVLEISEQTELNISETKYIKTGRKITGITFIVKIRQTDEIKTLQLEMEDPPKEQTHPIVERLISLGFAVETAKRYKTKYGIKRIERNIAYTLAKQQEGAVKDIPAYLNMAIKEDIGGGWDVAKTKAAEEKTKQQTVSNQREKQAELAHLQKMAEMAGVPLETLLPKQSKGGN